MGGSADARQSSLGGLAVVVRLPAEDTEAVDEEFEPAAAPVEATAEGKHETEAEAKPETEAEPNANRAVQPAPPAERVQEPADAVVEP
jgi:hypothetical protein